MDARYLISRIQEAEEYLEDPFVEHYWAEEFKALAEEWLGFTGYARVKKPE
jgi:hypothetical protein